MVVLSILVFAGAMALSIAAIALSIVPQWRRIARLAMGHVEPQFAPLSQLVVAERRIAVRRWATVPAVAQYRAAA